jgi:hypothetical protein
MLARLRFAWPVIFCCGCPASSPVARAPLESGAGGARPSAAASGVRYALPACPLSYEVLAREKSDLDGAGFDTERFMTLEATAQNGRMRLDAVVVGRALHDGVRGYGKPTSDYAPPLLETDGLGWTEREGPTWLFSEVGAPGGLAWFFPTLPASAEHGATAVWNVPFASGQSTAALRTEATRGRMGSLAVELARREAAGEKDIEIPTTFTRAEVAFEESHLEQGVRVFVFTMTAERHDESKPDDEPAFKMVKTCRGTYAVTASGRVLRAHVESTRRTTYGREEPGRRVQHEEETDDAKMHLVRACDGPVAPSIAPVLTAEERAMPAEDGPRIELPRPARPR